MTQPSAQTRRYWFARPEGNRAWTGGPQPVSWHGWLIFVGLVFVLVLPGQQAGYALWDGAYLAAAVWLAVAGAGAFALVRLRRRMTDPERTLEDYADDNIVRLQDARSDRALKDRNRV